jgi:hypothetical protein
MCQFIEEGFACAPNRRARALSSAAALGEFDARTERNIIAERRKACIALNSGRPCGRGRERIEIVD